MRTLSLVLLPLVLAACDSHESPQHPDRGPVITLDQGILPKVDTSSPPLVDARQADAAPAVPIQHKGIWMWGSTIRGSEDDVASWLVEHGYTDVFVLFKGLSGVYTFEVLAKLLKLRQQKNYELRVWAWMTGFQDKSHAESSWSYIVNDWINPSDPDYRQYLAELAERAINPSRGDVASPPDGLMLDDSFQWPSQKYGTSTANRVKALMGAVDAIRAKVRAASEQLGKQILLGFAPHPETGVQSQDGSNVYSYGAYAYGQDIGELAKRCDWIVPETYRYDHYPEPVSWIGKNVDNIKKEIQSECPERAPFVRIFPALVLYDSDTDPSAVSATDLATDRTAALDAAGGYSVFRYASGTDNPGATNGGADWPTASQNAVLDR